VKLTPGQVRELLDLSEETLRHWKRVLAPLRGRNGYRPCFTQGDVAALAIVKSLVDDVGLRISALIDLADRLFEVCNGSNWLSIERSKLILRVATGDVQLSTSSKTLHPEGTFVVVDCAPLIASLRHNVIGTHLPEEQQQLRFPPSIVSRRARGSSSP
jgi:DNA-binding transcriptional MerR regulator